MSTEIKTTRPCLSWRQPGGFWAIQENGEGERLTIVNTMRKHAEMNDLIDEDLVIIRDLLTAAIEHRKANPAQG